MAAAATDTYWEVANLVQQGRTEDARKLATSIQTPHVRGLALLLVNDSRRLTPRSQSQGGFSAFPQPATGRM